MKSSAYHLLSDQKQEEFFSFLQLTHANKSPASANMWHADWPSHPETLPYLLEHTDRFNGHNGEFHILYHDHNPVACGGVYISAFNKFIGIAGVRTWVDVKYRHHAILREFMLPLHKQWCNNHELKIIALTFNEYNKNLIQVFKRKRLGETVNRIGTRNLHHLFFNGLLEVPFPVTIQYTPQWAIYEKLDPNFEFDWGSLKVDKD
jgi:hypothetical protein